MAAIADTLSAYDVTRESNSDFLDRNGGCALWGKAKAGELIAGRPGGDFDETQRNQVLY